LAFAVSLDSRLGTIAIPLLTTDLARV
jgi:hypothetical protein